MTTAGPSRSMPLKGLRVANFGWVWVGAVMGHFMGDMGAEVIRVESKDRPDPPRSSPPFLGEKPGMTYLSINTFRSQFSVTLNLNQPEGIRLARDLVAQSDVVIENYRPGVMEKYGLDYTSLRALRPDIVMISLSTAGQTGPLRHLRAFGNNLNSLAGIDSLQGYYGDRPLPVGQAIGDPFNAVTGFGALLAALRYRNQTGVGQYVDLAQWEATSATLGPPMLDYLMNHRCPGPLGNRDPVMAPHGIYRCKGEDSWVSIAVETEEQWNAMREAMGSPPWAIERRFDDAYSRLRNQDELNQCIETWTRERTPWEVTNLLQGGGVAAFPCLSDGEVFVDPHFTQRGAWVSSDTAFGRKTIYGIHWKLEETPGEITRPCPLQGQDNDYVLHDILGLDSDDMRRLEGAIR